VLVDNFDAPSAVKIVKVFGANAELSRQGTLNEFFDPDGIRLQVTFPGQTYLSSREGTQHPSRDAQFSYLNRAVLDCAPDCNAF
jgi:hypothetical protein